MKTIVWPKTKRSPVYEIVCINGKQVRVQTFPVKTAKIIKVKSLATVSYPAVGAPVESFVPNFSFELRSKKCPRKRKRK